jgi:hypothetical protein
METLWMGIARVLSVLFLFGAVCPAAVFAADKEPVVLMPLRATGVDRSYYQPMESALAEGLSSKYTVFAGKRVADKVEEIFKKVSEETAAGKECDDTKCLQNIAIEFQTELVSTTTILKNPSGFFLTLNVVNVLEDKVVFSRSETCEGCTEFQVIELLKGMANGGNGVIASAPRGATLSVTSNPFELGADIYIDGEHKGKIPADIKLPAGKHLVDVKGATASGSKKVTIKDGRDKSISVSMKGEFKSTRFARIREDWLIRGGLNIGSGNIKPSYKWESIYDSSAPVVVFVEVGKRDFPLLLRLGVATFSVTDSSSTDNVATVDLTTSIIAVNWEGKNPVGWYLVAGTGTLEVSYATLVSDSGSWVEDSTVTDSNTITYTELGYRWKILDNWRVGLSTWSTSVADVTLFDVQTQAGFSGTGFIFAYEW